MLKAGPSLIVVPLEMWRFNILHSRVETFQMIKCCSQHLFSHHYHHLDYSSHHYAFSEVVVQQRQLLFTNTQECIAGLALNDTAERALRENAV